RAGAFLEEGSFVAGEKEYAFSCAYGISHCREILMNLCYIRNNRGWDAWEGFLNRADGGMVPDRFINVQPGDHRV
ncbi:MAG: hypothetical protein JRF69_10520, partial [Deltaproteobacteria bacterium]|nr:hypothetical protein [Deltaproteobacteria bacterium]